MKEIMKGFDKEINRELKNLYLDTLGRPISYDDGKTSRPRARHINLWAATPVFQNPLDVITTAKNPGEDIWIWSDLHFGHNNIIKFSNRPYPDVQTMDEMLIQNFNDLVKPDDISIWVGDVSFKGSFETKKIVHRLNGYKILIIGNHDFEKKKAIKPMAFDEVHLVYNLTMDSTPLAFTHYPMDNVPEGWIDIHGHVHCNGHHADEIKSNKHINVNCEFLDYKPINLNTLIEKVKAL